MIENTITPEKKIIDTVGLKLSLKLDIEDLEKEISQLYMKKRKLIEKLREYESIIEKTYMKFYFKR